MKHMLLRLAGLVLLSALIGCGGAKPAAPAPTDAPIPAATEVPQVTEAPAATAAPVAVPEPEAEAPEVEAEERILGHCLSILDQLPYSVDLEGDGTAETVDLVTYVPEDEYPRWAIQVRRGQDTVRAETDVPYDMPHDLWVGDLDEDGGYELFFHGDLASDDYLIYGFHSDLSCLFFEPDERAVRWEEPRESNVFAGRIEGFEDGHLVIEGVVDMLGTHWGVRNFALGEGMIGPVSTVWTFDDEIEAERPLTVTRELTAYRASVRKDPGDAFTLAVGEKIYPLASDGYSRLWFETEEGKGGVLLVAFQEEAGWLLDGVPEADYFEYLPYSG